MNKLICFFLIFFLFNFSSAAEIVSKNEVDKGETLSAKISGNFLTPLSESNLFLYQEHVRVGFDPKILKIEDDYYLYSSLLGKNPGNYTLVIKDIEYFLGGEIKSDEIRKNFSITDKTADFSVLPGAQITSSNFDITIQNLKTSLISIEIFSSTISGDSKSIFSNVGEIKDSSKVTFSLKSGEIKKISFLPEDFSENTFKTLKFKSGEFYYDFPLYIFKNINETNTTADIEFFNLRNFTHSLNESFSKSITAVSESGESLTYSLNDTLKFQINSETGLITNKTPFSEEEVYFLTILASDNLGNSNQGIFYINITHSEEIITPINNQTNQTNQTQPPVYPDYKIEFHPLEVEIKLNVSSLSTIAIYLKNTGQKTLKNINLTLSRQLSEYVGLSVNHFKELSPNSSLKINLKINSSYYEYFIEGQLRARTEENASAYLPLKINITKSYDPVSDNTSYKPPEGKIIEPKPKDENRKTESNTGKIIGWSILVVLLLVILWFYFKKYSKVKNTPNLKPRI